MLVILGCFGLPRVDRYNDAMRAMVLTKRCRGVLDLIDREIPCVDDDEVLIRVRSCGVCRTDLHVVDGTHRRPRADHPGPRGGRHGRTRWCPCRQSARGPARRGTVAGVYVRGMQLLHGGSRESLSLRRVHRLSARRRLRGVHQGRRSVRGSAPAEVRRCGIGSAAVCRADWLPCLPNGGRR